MRTNAIWIQCLFVAVAATGCGGGDSGGGKDAAPATAPGTAPAVAVTVTDTTVTNEMSPAPAPATPVTNTNKPLPPGSVPVTQGPAPAPANSPATSSPSPAPGTAITTAPAPTPAAPAAPAAPVSQRDAVRLAEQATFGATEALLADIKSKGVEGWLAEQMSLSGSAYTGGGSDAIHKVTSKTEGFCDMAANAGSNCWRDNYSSMPLLWNFYANAMQRPDQLRQRVAFALQQIAVVSNLEVEGTYGLRYYYNTLLQNAFGNYRQVLKKVALSPVMGDYLNNANNNKAAPNENFSRELLQLFSIGICELNLDGTLKGGNCMPTYDNEAVREYAFALTGWTYPAGGASPWGCYPAGANCRYYGGDMVPVERYHDTAARKLLSGQSLAAGHTTPQALEKVLDSLMQHPNIAPFIGKQLIQHLVSSNPSPAYVARVSNAFNTGRHGAFGTGQPGDLAATVAAVLLDAEARGTATTANAGRLREPVQLFTGVLRALNGRTDGDALGYWWGGDLKQMVFRPPSVFNFYPPNYPVAGTSLVGPQFGIHSVNSGLQRLNFLTYAIDWNGSNPDANVPGAIGTKVDLTAFLADAPDAAKLVDRLSMLVLGEPLPSASRTQAINAVSWWTSTTEKTNWQLNRVKAAAYLVLASPQYQVPR